MKITTLENCATIEKLVCFCQHILNIKHQFEYVQRLKSNVLTEVVVNVDYSGKNKTVSGARRSSRSTLEDHIDRLHYTQGLCTSVVEEWKPLPLCQNVLGMRLLQHGHTITQF